MNTLVKKIMTVAAGAMVIGTMAYGQTVMKAQIPFAFRTTGSTLPAGEYSVGRLDTHGSMPIATLQNGSTLHKVLVPGGIKDSVKAGNPAVMFRCTENGGCVLTGIRTYDSVVSYNTGYKSAHDKESALIVIPLRAVNAD
jgi:hypothetical protein